ncbi:MAG TPA: glycine cleavage system protein GcvH [Actinomycetota bacterium]|nr:glycine cleavage system protein GcvH [Actinomycetota bacterium]
MTEIPEDLRYTKEHEWARVEDGRVVVGITDYAQDQLGDVVFVSLPEPGSEVTAGQPLGEVESTKSVSDVYSPVTGVVLEKNVSLDPNPELINEDPYGKGWLVVIEAEGGGLEGLMDAAGYRAVIEGS